MAKIRPVELDLWFDAESGFIDLAQSASLVNRISLRQGYQYAVESITLFGKTDQTSNQTFTVMRLPNHWPMINSWVRCYEAWRQQEQTVLEDNPSLNAGYSDFKVAFNASHRPNPASNWASNKLPIGYAIAAGTATDAYEWQASQVVIPNDVSPGDTTEYWMHVLGTDVAESGPGLNDGTKAMIHGYAQARSRPQTQEPNIVSSESWLVSMFDVGMDQEEIWTNVREKNDEPPYLIDQETGLEYYPGGALQGSSLGEQCADLQVTQYSRQSTARGFLANCGLLSCSGVGDNMDDALVRIRLVPGFYKGFMARPMHEVN